MKAGARTAGHRKFEKLTRELSVVRKRLASRTPTGEKKVTGKKRGCLERQEASLVEKAIPRLIRQIG